MAKYRRISLIQEGPKQAEKCSLEETGTTSGKENLRKKGNKGGSKQAISFQKDKILNPWNNRMLLNGKIEPSEEQKSSCKVKT